MPPRWPVVNCYSCGCRLFDERLAGLDGGYCDACRPSPRDDGAWRVGERFDPLRRMHPQTCWWRYPLDRFDQIVYQAVDGWRAMEISLVTDVDIHDVCATTPLRSDHLYRVRITEEERWPDPGRGRIAVAIPWLRLIVDVLAPEPPGAMRPRWRQLTARGDTSYPRRPADSAVRTSTSTWPR